MRNVEGISGPQAGEEVKAQLPTYGVLIACTIENDPRQGSTVWIDLLEVEGADEIEDMIDRLTGKADDPCPGGWNDEGTYEVREIRGLGPRMSDYASEEESTNLLAETLAALAYSLQMLSPEEVEPFLTWAEGADWWEPGYLPSTGGHTAEDAVMQFQVEAALAAGAALEAAYALEAAERPLGGAQ